MTAVIAKNRRPLWMTSLAREGLGDVFFDRLWPDRQREQDEKWSPRVDLSKKEGKYLIVAEVPGIKKEDLSISFEDGLLTLAGKKEIGREKKREDYLLRETRTGSFSRSFRLPREVDREGIEATYENGLLTVILPQAEKSRKRKIEVH